MSTAPATATPRPAAGGGPRPLADEPTAACELFPAAPAAGEPPPHGRDGRRRGGARRDGRARLVLGVLAVKVAELSEANRQVRERLRLAMDSIQTFTDVVSDDEVLKRRDLAGLRARLLRQPRAFYERLQGLLQGQDDAASRKTPAESYTLGRLVAGM
ncbi:MAG: hypothetical protein U0835_01560 [Isosphaeraceae bacterium]